jgi:hypothetical protein
MDYEAEINQLLGRWIGRALEAEAALEAMTASLEGDGIACALIEREADTRRFIASPAAREASDVLDAIEVAAGATRTLITVSEPRWQRLFWRNAFHGLRWVACEPIHEDERCRAALVVCAASDAEQERVLSALPGVARGCSVVLEQQRTQRRVSKLVHTFNNHLASVMANLEYAAILRGVSLTSEEAPPAEEEDLPKAIRNAARSANELRMTAEKWRKLEKAAAR